MGRDPGSGAELLAPQPPPPHSVPRTSLLAFWAAQHLQVVLGMFLARGCHG